MHTVELLEQMCGIAEQLGFKTRQEWLGGCGGGACEFGGQKWIFIDLALNTAEQLDQLCTAIRTDPAFHLLDLDSPLQQLLEFRRAA